MNPPTVGGKFAAKDVGGGVPDAPGGVKTPPYDTKDKGDAMASLRAGHARPLQGGVNELRARGAREGGSPPPSKLAGGYPLMGGGVKPVKAPQASQARPAPL